MRDTPYNQIISSGKILTKESFINSKQKSINVVTHFPLFNHSDLIITNRFENISIIELIPSSTTSFSF